MKGRGTLENSVRKSCRLHGRLAHNLERILSLLHWRNESVAHGHGIYRERDVDIRI
jgi:hypothetical protein